MLMEVLPLLPINTRRDAAIVSAATVFTRLASPDLPLISGSLILSQRTPPSPLKLEQRRKMLNREPQIHFSLLSGQRTSARVTHASGELELSRPESLKLLVCSVTNAQIDSALLTSASKAVGPWERSLSPTSPPTSSATMCPAVLNTYIHRDTVLAMQNLCYFAGTWRRLSLQYLGIEKWHLKKKNVFITRRHQAEFTARWHERKFHYLLAFIKQHFHFFFP